MISDADFKYLGFDERQLRLLQGESDDIRRIVYQEGLKILMESGPGDGENTYLTTII